ncbi:MAG: tetratricopeptide repeat protein, partial [Gammaproteobacteria bacterium]|nr:tetratricopeptide repeat protein [Gammaproteobacteria bacterium]
ELEPGHPPAWTLNGRLLAALDQPRQARSVLKEGSRRFPADRELRLTFLGTLLEQGRAREARRELREMMQRWPDDRDLSFSLALLEWESGDTFDAERRMVTLAESGHREDEAWFNAGRIAASRRDYISAAGYFQNVTGPQYLTAQTQVAFAWENAGRIDDALALIHHLRQMEPEAAGQLYLAESEILARNGQAERALAVLDAAVADMPELDVILYARALAAERAGRIDRAEADLRLLLERQPDNPMVLNALGYTLADRSDRHEEALGYIERALRFGPEDPAILDSMGWVLFRLGRLDEAITWLRRAHAISRDVEISAHLGEALWQAGKRREARAIWKRARLIDPDNRALRRTIERLDP